MTEFSPFLILIVLYASRSILVNFSEYLLILNSFQIWFNFLATKIYDIKIS